MRRPKDLHAYSMQIFVIDMPIKGHFVARKVFWLLIIIKIGKKIIGLTLKDSDLIFIDTVPFIYFFKKHPTYYNNMRRLFDLVYDKNIQVITSIITYIEIATHPVRQGHPKLTIKYRDYFTHSENISLFPIDLVIVEQTVELRTKYQLKTPVYIK